MRADGRRVRNGPIRGRKVIQMKKSYGYALALTGLAVALPCSALVQLDIPPRLQWDNNDGYCGECSIQQIALYFGAYISQYRAREIIDPTQQQDVWVPENSGPIFDALRLNYQAWDSSLTTPQYQAYLIWAKAHLQQGHPVIVDVFVQEESSPDYDHIVAATGFTSTDTNTYHAIDTLVFNDNYEPTPYTRTFGSLYDTRSMSGNGAVYEYCIPKNTDYGCAVTGVKDTTGMLLPVSLKLNRWDEPNVSLGDSPAQLTATVTIRSLAAGSHYALLRYNTYTSVPTSGYLTSAYSTSTIFTATSDVHTLTDRFMSDKIVIYRCVPFAGTADVSKVTLTFDAQGGMVIPSSGSVTYGSFYGTLPTPERADYVFAGWWTGSGGTGTRVMETTRVTVSETHTLYAKWVAETPAGLSCMVGVACSLPVPFTRVAKVTGLPAGVKYNAEIGMIEGVPTRAGIFDVEMSAPGATSQRFTLTVAALPVWAQGTFNGAMDGETKGLATLSVTAAGKVTGKVVMAGISYTFSAASYAAGGNIGDGLVIQTTAKAGQTVLPLKLLLSRVTASQTLGVVFGTIGGQSQLLLYRDVWKDEAAKLTPFIGYYTATLPCKGECGSGYLAFNVDRSGKVKTAGKLADGTAVSQSGTLIFDATGVVFTVVYTAPSAYKGGCLFGLAEFVAPYAGEVFLRTRDGESFQWQSRAPQATSEYGKGFDREPRLTGGRYGTKEALGAYYAGMNLTVGTGPNTPLPSLPVSDISYASARWDPAGIVLSPVLKSGVLTGLVAPAAGKPTDADRNGVWDYSATNSVGLKISLTSATGIFKGSFLAWFDYPVKRHVSKNMMFEGALMPVRENRDDGVAGRGFFLWPDQSLSPVYVFKWSYDFRILLSE